MKKRVFIQTNNKQYLGARIAKHAIESKLSKESDISVEIMNVDELEIFKKFVGTDYIFVGKEHRIYRDDDLQSFTLSRFMPPELMGYEGLAVAIDPDIFALTTIEELFAYDLEGAAIAACGKKTAWDTSVMLLDCSKLSHWSIQEILSGLKDHTLTYSEQMTLSSETAKVKELPRIWNDLDRYTPQTKMIHMTERLTQPWKTGLRIDFTRNKTKKILGLIPREPILKLFGKLPSHYQPHPDPETERLFFRLANTALSSGAISESDINSEIKKGNVRSDILSVMSKYKEMTENA